MTLLDPLRPFGTLLKKGKAFYKTRVADTLLFSFQFSVFTFKKAKPFINLRAKRSLLFSFHFSPFSLKLFVPLKRFDIRIGSLPRWLSAGVDDKWYADEDYCTDDKHQEPHLVATHRYL